MNKKQLREQILWACEIYAHKHPKEKHSDFISYLLMFLNLN